MKEMDFDIQVKLAVYQHFAKTGQRPTLEYIMDQVASEEDNVLSAYQNLSAQRLLVLEEDGSSIRMASPFSGVPTQHVVESEGIRYHANCAWDALGVPAALHKRATIHSRCEQSREPLQLEVGLDGPAPSDWLFHCLVPAKNWWDDIVFT